MESTGASFAPKATRPMGVETQSRVTYPLKSQPPLTPTVGMDAGPEGVVQDDDR